MCILLVEDDPTLGQVLVKQLNKLGYVADLVLSAADAVNRFPQKQYDLIMMDIGLPDADGLETTAAIRRFDPRGKAVKIVGLTAGYASRKECLDAGMDDYFQKPVLAKDIKRMLERWETQSCQSC